MSKRLELLNQRLEILKKEYEIERLLRKINKIKNLNKKGLSKNKPVKRKGVKVGINLTSLAKTTYSDVSTPSGSENSDSEETTTNQGLETVPTENLIWNTIPSTSQLERILTTTPLDQIEKDLSK